MVTGIDASHVYLDGRALPASVVLWAAGVSASPLGKMLGAPTDHAGRVLVQPDLTLPGHSEVFVCGDMASLKQGNGKPVPGVAPAAMQMGEFAAKSIVGDLHGASRKPFEYLDKGSLATIGRSAAVADVFGLKMSGLTAWLTWLFVHVLFLIGFRSRVQVVWEWLWAYVTFSRGARLITGQSRSVVPPVRGDIHEQGEDADELEQRERKVG